jgi:hypothetical protein
MPISGIIYRVLTILYSGQGIYNVVEVNLYRCDIALVEQGADFVGDMSSNIIAAQPILGENRGNAGKGRPKGSRNKVNASLKEMILGALSDAGGKGWLAQQAQENPVAFMALLAKLLPHELKQDAESGPHTIRIIGGLPDD